MSVRLDVVDYDSAVKCIHHNGRSTKDHKGVSYLLMGNPGVGKTSVKNDLAKLNPDHNIAMIDCANLDLGDIAMPWIDRELSCTRYFPNINFKFHLKKPIIVALDELTKATVAVQNMLLPLVLEHRIGDNFLPEDSIVFATGNDIELNLGDHLKPHTRNRMTVMKFKCPSAKKFMDYAVKNKANELIVAYVYETPDVLKEFTDSGQSKNTRVFNPPEGITKAFFSPRSAMNASVILNNRDKVGHAETLASLIGCIGEAAALELNAFIELNDKLPTWEAIIADPMNIPLHDDPMAEIITTSKAVNEVTSKTMSAWLKYLTRLSKEKQGLFAKSLSVSDNSKAMANPDFIDWASKNNYLFKKAV